MKCKYCGAEMPDDANFCGKCTKPLKDTVPEISNGEQNMENANIQTAKQENNVKKSTKFGLMSMIIGLVSIVFSCMFLGFLGIFGIILGAVSLFKKEAKTGMAITGISCSAIAFLLSVCLLLFVGATYDGDSPDTMHQAEQITAKTTDIPKATPIITPQATPVVTPQATPETTPVATPEITPVITPEATQTPKPTLSPEEKKNNIQNALLACETEELKKYSSKEVHKVAGNLLKNLSFKKSEDYDTANTVAKTMVSTYSGKLDIEDYKDIVSSYKSYVSTKKELSGSG